MIAKKVVLIDQDNDYRENCRYTITSRSDYEVDDTFSSAEKLIKHYSNYKPGIIVFGLTHPAINGIIAIQKIRKYDPLVRILVNSSIDSEKYVFEAFCAGACGYILKDDEMEELINALDEISITDGAPMSPRIAKIVVESFQRNPNSPLSWRETEILASLADGSTYKSTADHLNIGVETVKSHVKNIYSKLHATSKIEAIQIAKRESLI